MKALIFEDKIVQIEADEFPVASALEWVDIAGLTPQPEVGWSYDGVSFAPPSGPSFDELKAAKRQEFKAETVVRMAAQVPAWDSFARIEFLVSISNLLNTTSMTTAQTLARDTLLYTRNTAIPRVNAVTTQAALNAIDPTAVDPFGDGTPWPS